MISFSMFLPTLIKLPFLSKTNLITYLIIAACKKNPPKQFFSELPNSKEKNKKNHKKNTKKKTTKKSIHPNSPFKDSFDLFFDASMHLYVRVCPSIGLPVVRCKFLKLQKLRKKRRKSVE